jgi:molecular chaperone GrpE
MAERDERDDGAREQRTDGQAVGDGEAEVERLVAERDEAVASWKRAQADYQNLRRRLQSDVDSAVARSKRALLTELLLVADYLERALAPEVATREGESLRAGIELTRSALLRALEREDVRPIPEGGAFDPAVHQAIESVPTGEHPSGTILSTSRRGYLHGGQVLRPAQVRVAAGPASDAAGGSEARAAR